MGPSAQRKFERTRKVRLALEEGGSPAEDEQNDPRREAEGDGGQDPARGRAVDLRHTFCLGGGGRDGIESDSQSMKVVKEGMDRGGGLRKVPVAWMSVKKVRFLMVEMSQSHSSFHTQYTPPWY